MRKPNDRVKAPTAARTHEKDVLLERLTAPNTCRLGDDVLLGDQSSHQRGEKLTVASGVMHQSGSASADDCLLIRRWPVKCLGGLARGAAYPAGGGRVFVRVWFCAQAPGLTLVLDPGWLRIGDEMFDGVIPRGEALRPLDLSRRYTRVACRQQSFGSRPPRIGVSEGLARAKGWKLVVGGSGLAGTGRCTAQPKPGSSGQSTGGVGRCRSRVGRARAAA